MCHIHVDVPRKCEALLKVEDCHLYERLPGADTVYAMDSGSMQFNNAVSKNPVYFQYDRGEVIPDSIVVANDEPTFVLNIKRGMLSALQLKIMNPSEYGKEHTLVDIFGKCPTRCLNQSDPLIYNTKRDLTMCKMPHVFEIQANPFTFVQTLYGGYRESEITEPVYPFGSTVDCEYTTNKRHRITDVKCLQEQVFRPLAYNGSIYATAMTNITQTLKLSGTKKFKSRAVDRHLHNRKISSILFEYEEDDDQNVASTDIFTHIQSMVDGFYTGTSQFIPGHFHQMVLLMRKSKANSLHHLMKDIWNCHGNNTNNCVLIRQMLEKDYFLDGLMSCGTPHCLSTFSHCIGHGHVTNPILHTFFMYDLALNHETSPRVLNVLLDICKSNNSVSCWMPFSVMLNKLMNSDQEKSAKMKDIAYDILTHTRESLGDICEAGVWESLTPDQQNSTMSKVILFLKVIGNVGKVIQTQYDVVETEIRKQIIPTVLNCAGNSDLPYKITKSALLALQKMSVTDNIKAVLFDVLRDINRDVSVRTSAFLLLAKEKDSDIIRQLIQIMHEDPMEYMRIYIATYVESALENEQPDLQREMWKKGIEDSGKELPKHPSLMIGRSRYLEMSRYFRLPLMMTHYGLQMEMDLVYNPASPTFQTVVIRLNYYNGQKHNLVECGVDVRGLDTLMNRMLGRGRGLYNILSSVLPNPEDMGGQSDSRKKFGVFHPDIVEELNKMLKVINYPQGDIPDGLLHWKVLDHEVMYTELQDLLAAFTPKNMKLSSMKLLESFIFHFNKGHHAVKTRSSKQMDLLKVMPTLSGAPLNLTVLVTSSVSGEMDAKFDVSLLWGIGPVEARASGAIKGAVEFLGEMNIKMRDFSRCGIQMVTQGEMGNTLVSRVTLTKEKQTESVKKHFMVTLESSNVHGSFRLAKFKRWFIFDMTFSDADHVRGIGHIIKNPVTLYLRYNGDVTAQRQMASHVVDVISRFDFNGGNNNSWIIEQKIHSVFPIYDFPKYLNFHAIQETPFSLLNYMFNSTLTLHNDDKASQQTEFTWAWIDLWQNNSLTRNKNTSQWTFTSTSKLKSDVCI
ncbi:hypothetical protein FSP39_008132 [Pinctada imbricata]|uniref:Vitellogenin domain-containing protein n=1 Tax=Pinctada imbricata TaxID=66713 RepID=A0AA88XZK4_PINIB|nr:hypothetical protein FSP39_008132 [Pinctada imbricata]